jgi:hypothetical protein
MDEFIGGTDAFRAQQRPLRGSEILDVVSERKNALEKALMWGI